jgi:aspartate/methionine/tyrosine aminotransferase
VRTIGRGFPLDFLNCEAKALAVAYPLFLCKILIRSGIARWLPAPHRLADGAGPFLHYYSDRVLSAPLEQLRDAASLVRASGPDGIDLAQGAPVFDLVPSASTKLPVDKRGWPPVSGLPALREAVARHLNQRHQLTVDPIEEVLITQGVTGAFSIALDTFINPGNRVALFEPTSPLYPLALRQRRARIRWIPTWMEAGRTRFHMEHLVKALRGSKMIVLTSPANPTGGVLHDEDLEQIAWWADRHDVLIFEDRAFNSYQYEGPTASIATLPKAKARTLIAGSVSKGYALASTRVGWLAGHRHLIQPSVLTAVLQMPFVPTLCQQIALTALDQGDESFRPILTEFESRRRYAFERLQAIGLKPAWPAGAFFLWVSVKHLGMTGQVFAERLMQTKKVLVTPGCLFGPSGSEHIRISYATDDGRLREGLARLTEYLRQPNSQATAQAA